ncbi:MAG: integrase core domain-containing protein [Acidimicrobiia bacterium]
MLFRAGGEPALTPAKRGPKTAPNQTPETVEDTIVSLRKHLAELGLDAGAATIGYHLQAQGLEPPARATIHRILVRRGFVTPQPQKRPRSSWQRFEAQLPNECWQSDMTHWHLDHDIHCEIINFIDDHTRAVLASVAVTTATATDVVRVFFNAAATYGLPASVLSDNGAIYTAAYRGAATGLEIELAALGITFKHGKPYHPQTQGKVERYHRTLKTYLRRRPPAQDLHELQTQIDRFVHLYYEDRPHQARGCPPMHAWRTLDKPRRSSTANRSSRTPRSATTRSTPPAASRSGTAHAFTTSGSAEPTADAECSSSSATSISESSPTTDNNSDTSPSTPTATTKPARELPSEGSPVPETMRQNRVEVMGLEPTTSTLRT